MSVMGLTPEENINDATNAADDQNPVQEDPIKIDTFTSGYEQTDCDMKGTMKCG